jgi:hypothetical protein
MGGSENDLVKMHRFYWLLVYKPKGGSISRQIPSFQIDNQLRKGMTADHRSLTLLLASLVQECLEIHL